MATMTLAVPTELKSKMEDFPEMNWSEVARQAIAQRIHDMEILRKFRRDSTISEKDALRMGAELNKGLARRYR